MAGRITEPRDMNQRLKLRSAHEDSATRSSRIYFFVILAIIAASFIVFLVLRPQ